MNTTSRLLDASTLCVLKNLRSFRQAERCLQQAEDRLEEVAREAWVAFPFAAEQSLNWWFDGKFKYVMAEVFPNWEGSNFGLLGIGLENLRVDNLVDPGAPGCHAFVFSTFVDKSPKTVANAEMELRLRGLPAPKDFAAVTLKERGYLFRKRLDCLSADSFCSAQGLADHLRAPLTVMVAWLAEVTPIVESFPRNPVSSPAEAGNP